MIAKKNTYYTSRKILVSYFVLLVIIPYILLSGIQIFTFIKAIRAEMIDPSREVVELINTSVENQVYRIQNFVASTTMSEEFEEFIQESCSGQYGYELNEKYRRLQNVILNSVHFDLKLQNVVIINRENRVFSFGSRGYVDYDSLKNYSWYQKTEEAEGKLCWFSQTEDTEGGFASNLIAAKKIYNPQTMEPLGTIYMEVENDFFDIRMSKEDTQYMMYVVDSEKKFLLPLVQNDSMQDRQAVESITARIMDRKDTDGSICYVNGSYYFPVVSTPNSHGWRVVKVISAGQMLGSVAKTSILSGSILICCFVLFLVMFLVVYKRIAQPMQYLIGLINEIKGDPEVNIDLGKYPCYEAMKLSTEIISLSREKETINNELKEISGVKTRIELDKLQAEINPHFIFNTLTAIKYMAVQNHQKEIADMITALVKILRSTVNRDGRFITVEGEVDNLEQYIHIQRVLNKDRIRFETEIASDVKKCYMPNFILQPLVENAVIHGLNPKGCEGTVRVCIGQRDGRLTIEITDDGVGVNPEKISISNPVHKKGTGMSNIALPGIMKKIELLYDQKGVFKIEPIVSGGTRVSINLPMKFEN